MNECFFFGIKKGRLFLLYGPSALPYMRVSQYRNQLTHELMSEELPAAAKALVSSRGERSTVWFVVCVDSLKFKNFEISKVPKMMDYLTSLC